MQLIHGDCLEKMKDIPDKSIDMILCDLPYGTTACKWDVVIPFEPLWEQYKRVIKDRGAIVLFGSEPFSSHLRMSNIKQYKYDWVWNKNYGANFMALKYMPLLTNENISVFSSGGANNGSKIKMSYYPIMEKQKPRSYSLNKYTKNIKNPKSFGFVNKEVIEHIEREEKYPKSVLNFSNANKKGRLHPTQKPVALLEYLIKTYTIDGETVLDNCMGSGSTGVACINTKRNFIGIEKDNKYFEIAKNRIEEHLTTAST
jgi:site-specific DNA-methyltransferase (adenine-specific)